MQLIKIREFQSRYFGKEKGTAPDFRTVRAGILRGEIPGFVLNKDGARPSYWVDAEAWEKCTGNALADAVLAKLQDVA